MFPNESDELFKYQSDHFSSFIGSSNFDWYALSYELAGDVLMEHINNNFKHGQLLTLPIIYLYRHFIELKLKSIIFYFIKKDIIPFEKEMFTHSLKGLWDNVRRTYESNFAYNNDDEKVDMGNAERLILELHGIDKGSMNFRYPIDKEQNQVFSFKSVNLDNFCNVIIKLNRFLSSLKDYIENS